MGFVQADPIRAPARAQDLILRHRVNNYRAGDLERRYEELGVEEDFFVNYGYVTQGFAGLMHPRSDSRVPADDVESHGPSNKENAHNCCSSLLRSAGLYIHVRWISISRMGGLRITGAAHRMQPHIFLMRCTTSGCFALRDVKKVFASMLPRSSRHSKWTNVSDERVSMQWPISSFVFMPTAWSEPVHIYLRRLRYAAPQWKGELPAALSRAKERLSHSRIDGVDWYWPQDESVRDEESQETVRIVAPFDPLVHDRARFEKLWGWVYRFEAYTPAAKRKLGYYAMPLLWRDSVIGWANLSLDNGKLVTDLGYVGLAPRGLAYKRELESELDRLRVFLNLKV